MMRQFRPWKWIGPTLLAAVVTISLAFSARARAGAQFERIGPFGGEVRSLLVDAHDPQTVYLGTSDGRIFRSRDAGESWNPLVPGIGHRHYVVDKLVQDPADHERIFAGAWDLRSAGGGLFESPDGGESWHEVALPRRSPPVRDVAISASNPSRLIVGSLAGVYLSADGGRTWKEVDPPSGELQKTESVAIDPEDPSYLYAGTWRLGYRSRDFGKSWRLVDRGMIVDSDIFSISIDKRNPLSVFASACTGIYRSTDRGDNWIRLRLLPDRFVVRAQVVYVDPIDSKTLYGGTTEGLFASYDGGQTWKRLTSRGLTINAVQVDPHNNRRIVLGTESAGILISLDGGKSWDPSNRGFVRRQVTRILPDPAHSGRFLAGMISDGDEGGLYSYDVESGKWEALSKEISRGMQVSCILPLPQGLGRLIGTSRGVFWQRPGERSWTELGGAIAGLRINGMAVDPARHWVFAATDTGIYRARSDRLQFRLPVDRQFEPRASTVMVSGGTPYAVYAGTDLGVMRSLDHGESWDIISRYGIPPRADINGILISPSDKGRMFAATSSGLFTSADGGTSWTKIADGRLGVNISSILFLDHSGRRVLAGDGTFGGLFYSEDGGMTWVRIESPGFISPVSDLAQVSAQPGCIYVGTGSDGVYRVRLPADESQPPPAR